MAKQLGHGMFEIAFELLKVRQSQSDFSIQWNLRSFCFCLFFGGNWRHEKDISKSTDLYLYDNCNFARNFICTFSQNENKSRQMRFLKGFESRKLYAVTWFERNLNGRPVCRPSRPLNNLKVKSLELRYWFGIPLPLAVWSIFPQKNNNFFSDYDYNRIKNFCSLKKELDQAS